MAQNAQPDPNAPAPPPAAPRRRPSRRIPVNPAPLARTKRSSEFEVMLRRKDVQRLRLRGHTQAEIAKRLNVSPETIKKDLSAIQKVNRAQVEQFDQSQFMGESLVVLEEVQQHAWEEFHASDAGSKQRIAALDLIRTTQNDKLKALGDVGLVTRAAQEVKITHAGELPWTDELKASVISRMLESKLTPQFALPTHDPHHGPGKNIEVTPVDAEVVAAPTVAVIEQQTTPADEIVEPSAEDQLLKKFMGAGMSEVEARAAVAAGKTA